MVSSRWYGIWLLAAVGCHAAATPPSDIMFSARDSAGTRIAVNRVTDEAAVPAIGVDSAPMTEIAQAVDTAARLLDVLDATILADDRIAILSRQAAQLLIYDQSGRFVSAIGRRGDGPGELRDPIGVRQDTAGRLVVWERLFGPQTMYDTAGRVVAVQHTDLRRVSTALGDSLVSERQLPTSDGGRVVIARVIHAGSRTTVAAEPTRPPGYIALLDSAFSLTLLGRYDGAEMYPVRVGGRSAMMMGFLFRRSIVSVASHPTRILAATGGSDDVIDVWTPSGRLALKIRRERPVRRIEDSIVARMRSSWLGYGETVFGPGSGDAALAQLPDQSTYPAILDLKGDDRGCIWARDGMYQWSVFSRQGRWVARVHIPLLRVFDIRDGSVLGAVADQDGFVTVRRYRLAQQPCPAATAAVPPPGRPRES